MPKLISHEINAKGESIKEAHGFQAKDDEIRALKDEIEELKREG